MNYSVHVLPMQAAFDAVTVGAPVFFLAEASTPSM
jgi:hypothetical protein